jgi:hypothetical protein
LVRFLPISIKGREFSPPGITGKRCYPGRWTPVYSSRYKC